MQAQMTQNMKEKKRDAETLKPATRHVRLPTDLLLSVLSRSPCLGPVMPTHRRPQGLGLSSHYAAASGLELSLTR